VTVVGCKEGPMDYRGRVGTIVAFGGRTGYRVKFDDTGISEYLNSDYEVVEPDALAS
jgi:hypothetical protein